MEIATKRTKFISILGSCYRSCLLVLIKPLPTLKGLRHQEMKLTNLTIGIIKSVGIEKFQKEKQEGGLNFDSNVKIWGYKMALQPLYYHNPEGDTGGKLPEFNY